MWKNVRDLRFHICPEHTGNMTSWNKPDSDLTMSDLLLQKLSFKLYCENGKNAFIQLNDMNCEKKINIDKTFD